MKNFLFGWLRGKRQAEEEGDANFRQVTFTFDVIALAAKLSACDGEAGEEEFRAFCELFPLPGADAGKARGLFMMACRDELPASHYARQIAELFPKKNNLKEEIVTRLCRIAVADGQACEAERQWLESVADILGVHRKVVGLMLAPARPAPSGDPYRLLGVTRKATAEEIKRAYRRRIRELHPDSLAAAGVAPEVVAEAGGALAAINAAYGTIARKRRIK